MARITWRGQSLDQAISPNTSIAKEFIRSDDGTAIGQKHTINIKGHILASGDPNTGDRQNYLYGKIKDFLGLGSTGNLNNARLNQQGVLEILPVGPGQNVIKYDNAQLISLNLPEPPEDTAGIQYQEYAFAFESTQPESADVYNKYRIKSVSENWEIHKQDDHVTFDSNNLLLPSSYYSYTVTHTLSAVGMQKYTLGNYTSAAWLEAYNYVNDRLKDDIVSGYISQDSYNTTMPASSAMNITSWKPSGVTATGTVINLDDSYKSYNRIRTSTVDVPAGSYAVTSTYLLSRNSGVFELNTSYNEDEAGDINITVEGTVTALTSQSISSNANDKFVVASSIFESVTNSGTWSGVTSLASGMLSSYSGGAPIFIDRYPRSITIGKNRITGSINFTAGYKGISSGVRSLKDSISGCIAASVNVMDDNRLNKSNLGFKSIAVIPILGRSGGPIIQDMGTTKERKRTVTFDVTMKQGYRSVTGVPTGAIYPIITGYRPVGSSYVQNFVETWDWINGKYNVTVDWIYT